MTDIENNNITQTETTELPELKLTNGQRAIKSAKDKMKIPEQFQEPVTKPIEDEVAPPAPIIEAKAPKVAKEEIKKEEPATETPAEEEKEKPSVDFQAKIKERLKLSKEKKSEASVEEKQSDIQKLVEVLQSKNTTQAEKQEAQEELKDEYDIWLDPQAALKKLKEDAITEAEKRIEAKYKSEIDSIKSRESLREFDAIYTKVVNQVNEVASKDVEFGEAYDTIRTALIDKIVELNPQATEQQVMQQFKLDELTLISGYAREISAIKTAAGVTETEAMSMLFKSLASEKLGWQPRAKAEAVKEKLNLNQKRDLKEKATTMAGVGANNNSLKALSVKDWANMTNAERYMASKKK